MNEDENKNIEQHYQSTEITVQKGIVFSMARNLLPIRPFTLSAAIKRGKALKSHGLIIRIMVWKYCIP